MKDPNPKKTAEQISAEKDLVISRRLRKVARKVEDLLRKELGEDLGFGLVVFPWSDEREIPEGHPAEFQYISNAPRDYMHRVIKFFAEKWDQGYPDVPPHLKQ